MAHNYTVTSELRPVQHGLVDYVADGYIDRDGEKIPCLVGFTEFGFATDPETIVTHIFIKDGITADGTHYEAETIEV